MSTPADRLRWATAEAARLTAGRPTNGTSHDDADGDAGTIGTDDAVNFDPLRLLGAIHRHGARVVVIGQVAGILHGSREPTGDLDLLWSGAPADAPALAAAFADVGATLLDDDHRLLSYPLAALSLDKVQFRSTNASGDCCTPRLPWRGLAVRAFIERSLSTTVDGSIITYLRLDDLLAMREAVDRPKDRRRAAELRGLR